MTSYFGELFLALSDRIKTEVPQIRWIDQDLGQLENYETKPEVAFPCVLIDFGATTYSNLTENAQVADVTVFLRLGFAPYSQSNSAAPTEVKEKALEYYAIEQKLYEAVQGWQTEYSSSFTRMSADSEQRDDKLRVRLLTFLTGYEDYSMLPVRQRQAADLQIDTTE